MRDPARLTAIRELLAALAHEQWAGWMRHLFSKCLTPTAGPLELCKIIPPEWSARWSRQMHTPYAELSDAEKDSDRAEADRVLTELRDLLLWVDTLQQERDAARSNLRFLSEQHPCVICGWPRPHDNEHNICECCGFQEGYDAPDLYRWDGAWWAKDRERQPKILRAAEAKVDHLTSQQARLRASVEKLGRIVQADQSDADCVTAVEDWLDQALAEALQP